MDTIILFVGYYNSGIVYSIDGGAQWTHWFANSPAHYFGLIECGQSYYYTNMKVMDSWDECFHLINSFYSVMIP